LSPNGDKFDAGLENRAAIQSLAPTIRYSIASGVIFYIFAAILFLYAARNLESDWQN